MTELDIKDSVKTQVSWTLCHAHDLTNIYRTVALVVKNLLVNAGDIGDAGSIPVLGRPPGGECGNPLQWPCLENPHTGSPRVRHDEVTLQAHTHRICATVSVYTFSTSARDISPR